MTNEELKKYIDDKIDSLIILLREHYIPQIISNIWLKSSNEKCGDILYKLENMEKMLNDLWYKYFGEKEQKWTKEKE